MTRLLLAAVAVLLVLSGLQTWRLDRVKAELVAVKIEMAALEEFKSIAVTDAQNQSDQCQARVDDARRSAQRIETIVERPVHVDPQGCAVRELIPSDELRDALQP